MCLAVLVVPLCVLARCFPGLCNGRSGFCLLQCLHARVSLCFEWAVCVGSGLLFGLLRVLVVDWSGPVEVSAQYGICCGLPVLWALEVLSSADRVELSPGL
ncbi:hypothetical protein OIU78_024367 [Salix suchowensis]|nr:hypothetical protein OIU78_024367 [Salix suchowensis]